MFDFNLAYDFLAEEIVDGNTDALDLAFSLCGKNEETAKNILWFYTGYSDFEQFNEDFDLGYDF